MHICLESIMYINILLIHNSTYFYILLYLNVTVFYLATIKLHIKLLKNSDSISLAFMLFFMLNTKQYFPWLTVFWHEVNIQDQSVFQILIGYYSYTTAVWTSSSSCSSFVNNAKLPGAH